MPDTESRPGPEPADWLDGLLCADGQAHRDAYLDDQGFTARVMTHLPPPAGLPRWRKPALTGLWAVAGAGIALALPGAALDVAREAFQLLAAQPFSLSEVAGVLALLGIATWTGAAVALQRD